MSDPDYTQTTLGLLLVIATTLVFAGCSSSDDVVNPPLPDRFVDDGDGTGTRV